MELPTNILLEMAKEPEANEGLLEAAVVRLEETIEEKVEELPLNEVIEMLEDPDVAIPIIEIAVEKIAEAKEEILEVAVIKLKETLEEKVSELPLEEVLE